MKITTAKTVRVVVTLAASVALVACGSDEGGGDSPQDGVADLLIESADEAGADVDADCVRETAQGLSDADATALVEAGFQGDPDISTEASGILAEMLLCEN